MNFTARLVGGLMAAGLASLAGLQPVAAAAAGNTQQRLPAPSIVNPCNGELVSTTGTLHTAVFSHGNHLLIRDNFQGVKGVGAVTGLRYIVVGATQSHGNFNRRGQSEFTTVMHLHLIAPGTGQNFMTKLVFHNTLTPSGRVHVTLHSSQRCMTAGGKARIAGGTTRIASHTTAGHASQPAARRLAAKPAPKTTLVTIKKASARHAVVTQPKAAVVRRAPAHGASILHKAHPKGR